jgi:hypothetical protein
MNFAIASIGQPLCTFSFTQLSWGHGKKYLIFVRFYTFFRVFHAVYQENFFFRDIPYGLKILYCNGG